MVARPAATAAGLPGRRRHARHRGGPATVVDPSATTSSRPGWPSSGTGDQTAPLPMTGFAALPTSSPYTA